MRAKVFKNMKIGWEKERWLFNREIIFAILITAILYIMDIYADGMGGSFLKDGWDCGAVELSMFAFGGLLNRVGLCLCVFASAGLFAEDEESNTLYMRIQRVGKKRYSVLRTLQCMFSSFIVGALSYLCEILFLVIVLKQSIWTSEGTSEWLSYDSQMILNNNMIGFILMTACLCGLGTAFYGALTMIFSLLVQNRKCILVFPVLMWYFNQYMLNRIHLVPDSIQPSILFSGTNFISNLLDISEWAGIVYLAAYVGITYIITYLLIRIKLQRV